MNMENLEKGTILEIKVPNVENPIKAVILDIIEINIIEAGVLTDPEYNAQYDLMYILYAQKRIFKARGELFEYYTDEGLVRQFTDLRYSETIIDYCDIPDIPSDI